MITALATSLVWILAIVASIGSSLLYGNVYWMSFIWAVPLSFTIILIFNSIWGPRELRAFYVTALTWTLIAAVYLELGLDLPNGQGWKLWMLFFLGGPATIAAILWSHIKTRPTPKG